MKWYSQELNYTFDTERMQHLGQIEYLWFTEREITKDFYLDSLTNKCLAVTVPLAEIENYSDAVAAHDAAYEAALDDDLIRAGLATPPRPPEFNMKEPPDHYYELFEPDAVVELFAELRDEKRETNVAMAAYKAAEAACDAYYEAHRDAELEALRDAARDAWGKVDGHYGYYFRHDVKSGRNVAIAASPAGETNVAAYNAAVAAYEAYFEAHRDAAYEAELEALTNAVLDALDKIDGYFVNESASLPQDSMNIYVNLAHQTHATYRDLALLPEDLNKKALATASKKMDLLEGFSLAGEARATKEASAELASDAPDDCVSVTKTER